MSRQLIYLFTFASLLFSACTTQSYVKEESAFIVFKTPTFKYADLGFVYENSQQVKAEIYSSGQPVMSLIISDSSVCMNLLACMSHKKFNAEVLSAYYPEGVIEDIFRGKAIFQGLNLQKSRNGFTQNIINQNKYKIEYTVFNKETVFRDRINHILIKVKKQ